MANPVRATNKALGFRMLILTLPVVMAMGCEGKNPPEVARRYTNNGQIDENLNGGAGGQKPTAETGYNVAPMMALTLVALNRTAQAWDVVQNGRESKRLEKCQRETFEKSNPKDNGLDNQKVYTLTLSTRNCPTDMIDEQIVTVTYQTNGRDQNQDVLKVEAVNPRRDLTLKGKIGRTGTHNIAIKIGEEISLEREAGTAIFKFTYKSVIETNLVVNNSANAGRPARADQNNYTNNTLLVVTGRLNTETRQWQITNFSTDLIMQPQGRQKTVTVELLSDGETTFSPWMDADECGRPINGKIEKLFQTRQLHGEARTTYRPVLVEFDATKINVGNAEHPSGITFAHPACGTGFATLLRTLSKVDESVRRIPGAKAVLIGGRSSPTGKPMNVVTNAPTTPDTASATTNTGGRQNTVTPPSTATNTQKRIASGLKK